MNDICKTFYFLSEVEDFLLGVGSGSFVAGSCPLSRPRLKK